jgi:tetratricopeptide (TPR) repeat protein
VLRTTSRTPGNRLNRQGQLQQIFDLEKQLVFAILAEANYTLSPTEREKINENKAANLLAFLAYGRGLEALDRGDYDQANAQFRQATQADPNFSAARVQTAAATQLSDAAQTTTSEIAVQQALPSAEPSTLTKSIASDLNPSPATTIANSQTDNNGSSQVTPTATERQAPTTEATTSPQISQAKKASVIITVPNPTRGGVRAGGK